MSPPPDIFFKFSRGSDRKNKQARPSTNEQRLINGVGSAGTPWSVTPAVHYSAYFQGIMLETLL